MWFLLYNNIFLSIISKGTTLTSLGNYTQLRDHRIASLIKSSTVATRYANTSLSNAFETQSSTRVKSRAKRSIIQLAGMIRCVSGMANFFANLLNLLNNIFILGCDPLSYKSYGCYCGYLGAGEPVDVIDR